MYGMIMPTQFHFQLRYGHRFGTNSTNGPIDSTTALAVSFSVIGFVVVYVAVVCVVDALKRRRDRSRQSQSTGTGRLDQSQSKGNLVGGYKVHCHRSGGGAEWRECEAKMFVNQAYDVLNDEERRFEEDPYFVYNYKNESEQYNDQARSKAERQRCESSQSFQQLSARRVASHPKLNKLNKLKVLSDHSITPPKPEKPNRGNGTVPLKISKKTNIRCVPNFVTKLNSSLYAGSTGLESRSLQNLANASSDVTNKRNRSSLGSTNFLQSPAKKGASSLSTTQSDMENKTLNISPLNDRKGRRKETSLYSKAPSSILTYGRENPSRQQKVTFTANEDRKQHVCQSQLSWAKTYEKLPHVSSSDTQVHVPRGIARKACDIWALSTLSHRKHPRDNAYPFLADANSSRPGFAIRTKYDRPRGRYLSVSVPIYPGNERQHSIKMKRQHGRQRKVGCGTCHSGDVSKFCKTDSQKSSAFSPTASLTRTQHFSIVL